MRVILFLFITWIYLPLPKNIFEQKLIDIIFSMLLYLESDHFL